LLRWKLVHDGKELIETPTLEDLAMYYIHYLGTTGKQKGAMLSYRTIMLSRRANKGGTRMGV